MSGPPLRSYSNNAEFNASAPPPIRANSEPAPGQQPPVYRGFYPQLPLVEPPNLDAQHYNPAVQYGYQDHRYTSGSTSPVASGSGLPPSAPSSQVHPPVLSPAARARLGSPDPAVPLHPVPEPAPVAGNPHHPSSSSSDVSWPSWWSSVDGFEAWDWIKEHYPADQHPHIAAVSSFKHLFT